MSGSRPRSEPVCIRCGLVETQSRKLYPCQLTRWYRKPDGRPSGRSLGPVRVCRTCAIELLKAKTAHEHLRSVEPLR